MTDHSETISQAQHELIRAEVDRLLDRLEALDLCLHCVATELLYQGAIQLRWTGGNDDMLELCEMVIDAVEETRHVEPRKRPKMA